MLSDAFMTVLDGGIQTGTDDVPVSRLEFAEQDFGELAELLDRVLEQKFRKMLQEMQEVFAEQMCRNFREYMRDFHFDAEISENKADADEMEQMQEPELSEDMMAFAFAMGE